VYIIAEIGINHNGDINLAKDMISEAKNCGADAVKFQKRNIDFVYTQEFLEGPRDTPAGVLVKLPSGGTTQRQQKEALEFNRDEYQQIDEHCKAVDIDWFASSWDVSSLHFMDSFNPPYHKIASPMVTNKLFVEEVARLGRQVIISTGACMPQDTRKALDTLDRYGCKPVLMHCVLRYPNPPETTYLQEIGALKHYGYQVGYSGHESGTTPTIFACAVGATYIERHFTTDRSMYGSDQSASLEPDGFRRIVNAARLADACMQPRPIGFLHPDEIKNAAKMRYWEAA